MVLVSDGRTLASNLRRERMTGEELEAEARQQQIASLDDVRFAVLETNGKISFASREPPAPRGAEATPRGGRCDDP